MLRCKHAKKMTAPIRYVFARIKIPPSVSYTIDVDALSLL
jgi:hypothetical protein